MTSRPTLWFRVQLRLLATDRGGRRTPILSDYRPSWDVGNTWEGQPTLNDGRIFLEGQERLAPGEEGIARLVPMAPQFWAHVRAGMELPMQEGPKVVGYATVLEIGRAGAGSGPSDREEAP